MHKKDYLSGEQAQAKVTLNLSITDKLKNDICNEFKNYLSKEKITQVQLANKLAVDPARISEITKKKINLFTADRLLGLLERIKPDINVEIVFDKKN